MPKSKLAVGLFDLHWPEIDEATVAALYQFCEQNRPDFFILGGDALTNRMISPHTKDEVEIQSEGYIEEVEKFDTHFLKPFERVLPRKCVKVFIRGNHEDWENQYIAKNPNMKGITSDKLLKLKDRGWVVKQCGEVWSHGQLTWMHGEWLGGGQLHAKKAVDTMCENVVYGHFHTMQSFTKVLPYHKKHKYLAQCAPIGGQYNPQWVRNAPNGWVNGFILVEYHSNGNFNLYPVVVSDGRFSYGGKMYGAK
jgi:hypothetical protein